jgi:hypothetical protein
VNSGDTIPSIVAEGVGANGGFTSKVDRVLLPSRVTWRDYPQLTAQVRTAVASAHTSQPSVSQVRQMELPAGETAPETFLYAVRTALMSGNTRTNSALIYNGKQFLLHTRKEPDLTAGTYFVMRDMVSDANRVMLLSARIEDCTTGQITPFRVWFESGQEHLPPLRFEYQAKSFLRLVFEFDPAASGPPVGLALNKKENV